MECLSVSVAMATFNGAMFLEQQLADIAAQSVPPSELVVCDDRSSDDSLSILGRFASTVSFPVRIHRNDVRLGYRANFLKCASLCGSELIAFCDQDDRWAASKIEAMRSCFNDPDVLLAFHGARVMSKGGKPAARLPASPRPAGATPPLGGSPWTFALGFTQVFRRWLCRLDDRWPLSRDENTASERLAHDQWYFFLASVLGTIVHVESSLVDYRQHSSNVYGWTGGGRNLAGRVRDRIAAAKTWSARCAEGAMARALILEAAAAELDESYRHRAKDGASAYRQLSRRCELRAGIYADRSIGQRVGSLASLVRSNGYGSDPWRFGGLAFAMDLLVGVPGLQEMLSSSRGSKAELLP